MTPEFFTQEKKRFEKAGGGPPKTPEPAPQARPKRGPARPRPLPAQTEPPRQAEQRLEETFESQKH